MSWLIVSEARRVSASKKARGFGDLSENSGMTHQKKSSASRSRINKGRQILSVIKVVEGGSSVI